MRIPTLRLAGRQPRNPRVLLVPDQWSGSVQEYYHFLLGYLAPVVLWTTKHPGVPVSVRDCGPMNAWFDLLQEQLDLEVLSPGDMLHLFAARARRHRVLKGMDDPTSFDSQAIHRFRDLVLANSSISASATGSVVTVVDRLSSGEFNLTREAEVPASGQAVRSTPNLSSAAEAALRAHNQAGAAKTARIDWAIIDAAGLAPHEQLQRFARTRVLVGQHGAGLTNMLWMAKGGVVIEIEPPRPDYEPKFFRLLAAACGHRYTRIVQAHDHAPVDEIALADALTAALASTGRGSAAT